MAAGSRASLCVLCANALARSGLRAGRGSEAYVAAHARNGLADFAPGCSGGLYDRAARRCSSRETAWRVSTRAAGVVGPARGTQFQVKDAGPRGPQRALSGWGAPRTPQRRLAA